MTLVLALLCSSAALAFGIRQDQSRLEERSLPDPSLVTDVDSREVGTLAAKHRLRLGWERFLAEKKGSWRVQLDGRSGAPLLVEGSGIRWPVAQPKGWDPADDALRELETSFRAFLAENRGLLQAADAELVFDREASGPIGANGWQVVFVREVDGVRVEGDRYVFHLVSGNLVSFGASRWTTVDVERTPALDAALAAERMMAYMGLTDRAAAKPLAPPRLILVPQRAEGGEPHSSVYAGEVGRGYASALAWRIVLSVEEEPGSWVGMVDAHSGRMLAFFDDDRYAQVKGGVHPESPDGFCPSGCEQPNYPMPFANVSINGSPAVTANSMGLFACAPVGGTAVTQLQSPTIRIADACGAVNETMTCSASGDLDLAVNLGTNCTVPAGHSAGDTKASRSCFWSANRRKEHARAWLPGNVWVNTTQTQVNSNVNNTCNAGWTVSQQLNMYRAGNGCNNTCEVAGVVQHEWGHGMDQNDGGGFDNSSEAYADITEFLTDHSPCIGRGFWQAQTCTGYGDTCLTCTGIRDMDWNARTRHQPARIGLAGNLITSCSSGSGPCGKEVHCESYLAGEAVYDLAARDLPAAGLDQATAWALVDRLWYQSRTGSAGNMYTCTAGSGGCGASSLYQKLRVADDDDGNLANGTPHAAAIYAAFARHDIACGAAGDASNQSTAVPPVAGGLALTASGNTNAVGLSWTVTPPEAVGSYRVLRNDVSCDYSFTPVGTTPSGTTSFTDTGLANGFPLYYRVQAIGANPAHESPVSDCIVATPQPFAGTLDLDEDVYSCAASVGISVVDGNVGATTLTVAVQSTSETTPENVVLTQVSPGNTTYLGTISTTSAPPAADGQLSLAHGDAITVTYVDADDGNGGLNVPQQVPATSDCLAPAVSNVQVAVTGRDAVVTWTTDEPSSSRVAYGEGPVPSAEVTLPALVTSHTVPLTDLTECADHVFSVHSTDPVGNTGADDNGGTFFAFTTGLDSQPSFASTGSVAIPDNNPNGASSTIAVAANKPVVDVDVTVNVTHLSVGQLVLSLVPPTGAPIVLSNRRGGTGDHLTGTIFDDEAALAISAGTAPFTGRFRPDSPLSATDGILSGGNWSLLAVDAVSGTSGTIASWTLALTFPSQACGPHAKVNGHTTVADICSSGGGGGNGRWDAGETVQVSVELGNDGTDGLSNVTATLTSPTPGVVIVDGTASYPDLGVFAASGSSSPHFAVRVPLGASCDDELAFDVQIDSAEGGWSGSFAHRLGEVLSPDVNVLLESFAGGIPAGWTVVDGGSGGGAASTWTTANPGNRIFSPPMVAPVVAVDSDNAGSGGPVQDEQLITPVLDLSDALTATLQFDQFFRWFSGNLDEKGDVDVRSSLTGGGWVNVFRNRGASSANPDHRTIDITAQAAGASDVQIRFHYYDASFEWWWQVDSVRVDMVIDPPCVMTGCAAPSAAKPVPALTASRVTASTLAVTWDVVTCASPDHQILYGSLATLPSYTLLGSVCGIGTTGSTTWTDVPAGDLWFIVTGVDGAGTEATWGQDSAGGHRGGGTVSGQCGNVARDNGASCP